MLIARRIYHLGLLLCVLVLAGLACNLGGSEDTPESEIQPKTEVEGTSDQEPSPVQQAAGIANLDQVKDAIVQIEAQGTFIDPEVGLQVNVAGRGSGFIIDPAGIAVTNNHVVTGAALLKVWVGGESEPRNARVLGVSECSDLAVIDIEGDNHPYLQWYEGDINVGLEVYAAGFPLGDPEFTLTKGIVSKARAGGETDWASVDNVLEHDATINPGNSGGPLVDSDGRVVGINYAASSFTSQYFAIARREALEIIDVLSAGGNVDSVGVNGVAVTSDDGSLSGIWVSSVASGSPADEAGIKPGDILTTMEGLVLATDGTMADYCDILRTHGSDATLGVEVLRYSTGEFLAGQLNGRPLETSFSFESQLGPQISDEGSGTTGSYSGYVMVSDDYDSIQVEVPMEWADVNGAYWTDAGEVIGAGISAAGSLDAYYNYWDEPGMFFGASDDLALLAGYVQFLDSRRSYFGDACELDGRYDYEDALYRGKYDLFVDCGGPGGSWFLVLTAVPIDSPTDFLILVEVQIVTDADLEAVDHIMDSFQVVGVLP